MFDEMQTMYKDMPWPKEDPKWAVMDHMARTIAMNPSFNKPWQRQAAMETALRFFKGEPLQEFVVKKAAEHVNGEKTAKEK